MNNLINEVLIVGAGPTGLILANELLRRKIPVRLIEKRNGPSHTTRAMTIHARSMEMFEHMGLAHRLEEVCLKCPGNIYHFPHLTDDDCPRTDYRVLPTRFAFYYKINQNDFEQVLREHLFSQYSLKPEYQTELTAVNQHENAVTVNITLPNGAVQEKTYPWVVGCDGVRSFVREAAGIKFSGEEVAVMAMMDVELENVNFDDRWMNYYFNETLFMNCTKLPGKYWRIYMSDATGEYVQAENQQQAFQYVADQLNIGFKVGKPEWVTAWSVRNGVADRYREGRLLICGDASHVHSPSGGQGMNGCMQDAFNLGWKLASVYKNISKESILNSYEKERKPIGEQISEGAMATHEIVMGFGIKPEDRLHYTQKPNWEAHTIRLVSGLSHNYCAASELPKGLSKLEGPQAGERAPDALLMVEPQKRLYDVLRHPLFTLLYVPGQNTNQNIALASQLRDTVDNLFPNMVVNCLISQTSSNTVPFDDDRAMKVTQNTQQINSQASFDFDHHVSNETTEIFERYAIGNEGRFILIRPDLYIAMTCLPEEGNKMLEYLEQWFTITHTDTQSLSESSSSNHYASA
ncbi:FAD-dependent monooxygenase [Acinetobacter indicus]|uniref:Alkyl hydroperoxide reductase subunit F n=1 Tax=Acinetobacter indicus CIP 110367 TaxID=1341679 RepID=V2U5X8_9GAMM|nr:FAD-dependent monooxygenase [Acinetobacter indicus]EPF75121.1 hypothetical protein F956_00362 [Acinetobacter indicus ANC 4215]ESK49708.1 hypothetical protein P253_00565 [Acinetobacter indicus CIP 110367]